MPTRANYIVILPPIHREATEQVYTFMGISESELNKQVTELIETNCFSDYYPGCFSSEYEDYTYSVREGKEPDVYKCDYVTVYKVGQPHYTIRDLTPYLKKAMLADEERKEEYARQQKEQRRNEYERLKQEFGD